MERTYQQYGRILKEVWINWKFSPKYFMRGNLKALPNL